MSLIFFDSLQHIQSSPKSVRDSSDRSLVSHTISTKTVSY